ncbi:endolytic transglycosylase MltG [Lysinibacillus sp. KU-BSD001]|uniref:endolytic transglycosylase MltG n=1 Tax=Lysinibacillus sp. KU-BSD001 TaxID=3141328 RepID=UPI0036E2B917
MDNEAKKQEMLEKMRERKSEVKIVRKIVSIVALIFLLIVAIGGFAAYSYITSALKPLDPESTEEIAVEIPMGSGVTSISEVLEKNGIIKDARIFKYYAKFKNESQFQAGNYQMTKAMTLDEIIESLKTGKVYREPLFAITIPEGLNLEQIANVIEKKTDFTAEEFMTKVTDKAFIEMMMAEYPNLLTTDILGENVRYPLEGYLYPATYPFYEEKPTIESIIETMIAAMDTMVMNYKAGFEGLGMSVHEFVTFASLLEEEATAQTDRETIASVFYNRLDIDMPLQTDPTVLYALGEHKDRVLYADLEVEDPYNTYKHKGLTPGPISSPGKISLEAAISPSDTQYLYFLADKEGNNHFAKTYEEHLSNVAKYIQ